MRFKIALSSVILFSLAACSGAPSSPPTSVPATAVPTAAPTATLMPMQIVTVSMNNFNFIFTPTQITSGVVKFVVHNDAVGITHEFLLFKTDLAVNKLPTNPDGTSIVEDSPSITKVGSVEDVDAGASGEFTATLAAGHYVYFCNTIDHYKLGMAGEFTLPAQGAVALAPTSPMTSSMDMASTGTMTPTVSMTPTEVVTVSMTNYAFQFTPITITAGTVKFFVKNDAADVLHEMFLVKTDLDVKNLPMTADGSAIDEESNLFTKLGSVEDVDPGKSGEMTVDLAPGQYIYFCNKAGHYKLGMAGVMTVVP